MFFLIVSFYSASNKLTGMNCRAKTDDDGDWGTAAAHPSGPPAMQALAPAPAPAPARTRPPAPNPAPNLDADSVRTSGSAGPGEAGAPAHSTASSAPSAAAEGGGYSPPEREEAVVDEPNANQAQAPAVEEASTPDFPSSTTRRTRSGNPGRGPGRAGAAGLKKVAANGRVGATESLRARRRGKEALEQAEEEADTE